MEKYLICSDIHGSELYFKKVYDYYKNNGYTKMIILGDLLYHGPRNDLPEGYHPKGIIPLVNEIKDEIIMVKGNCDAEVDQMVVSFHIYNKKKLVLFGKNVYLEHGHHLDKNKFHIGDIIFYDWDDRTGSSSLYTKKCHGHRNGYCRDRSDGPGPF